MPQWTDRHTLRYKYLQWLFFLVLFFKKHGHFRNTKYTGSYFNVSPHSGMYFIMPSQACLFKMQCFFNASMQHYFASTISNAQGKVHSGLMGPDINQITHIKGSPAFYCPDVPLQFMIERANVIKDLAAEDTVVWPRLCVPERYLWETIW